MRSDEPLARARAAARLARDYSKPIYKHARAHWRRSQYDAEDILQGFLAEAFQRPSFFRSYDPERGPFRRYLRTCLDNFMVSHHRREQREPVAVPNVLSFDAAESERELAGSSFAFEPWESLFDRYFAQELLRTAIEGLRVWCVARENSRGFEVFRQHALARLLGDEPTYTDIASALKISVESVTSDLHSMRLVLRKLIRQIVCEHSTSREECRQQLQELLGFELDPA